MKDDVFKDGGYWIINKELLRKLGSDTAILISDLVDKYDYHIGRDECIKIGNEQYFFYTAKAIKKNTTFSYATQKNCLKILSKYKLVKTKLLGTPAKLHFCIYRDNVKQFIEDCVLKSYNEKPKHKNQFVSIVKGSLSNKDLICHFTELSKITDFSEEEILLKDMPYRKFLKTLYWKCVANMVRIMNDNKCQRCGSTDKLNIHHTTYDIHGREHQNLDLLECLCEKCHSLEHKK